MSSLAVWDVRRQVKADAATLMAGRRFDKVLSFSPLASWLLERAGVPYSDWGDDADTRWYHEQGLQTMARLEAAFAEACPSEPLSWYGLVFPLMRALDYALFEELRWRALAGRDVTVFTDLPRGAHRAAEATAYLNNQASLYLAAAGEHVRLDSDAPSQWKGSARAVAKAALRRARGLWMRLSPPRPAILGGPVYDWAAYADRFSGFRFVSLEQASWEIKPSARDRRASERDAEKVFAAVEARFAPVLPLCWPALSPIARRQIKRYAALRATAERRMPELIRRWDARGSVTAMCSFDYEFLLNYYLKAAGKPTFFHQHGGYQTRTLWVYQAERIPATHNFVYGPADADFMSAEPRGGEIVLAGSAMLRSLTPQPPGKGRFLYMLYHNGGNAITVDSEWTWPAANQNAFFARHRRVIELFRRNPRATLVIREHPASRVGGVYEPLREAAAGAPNVVLDESRASADEYLAGYEAVIMDYPCTGLLQAFAKKQNVACFTGMPHRMPPGHDELLSKGAVCSDDEDSFLAALEEILKEGFPAKSDGARLEYLERYGGPREAGDAGQRALAQAFFKTTT